MDKQRLEKILQANNLTKTYTFLPFRVISHLLYRFAYGYADKDNGYVETVSVNHTI